MTVADSTRVCTPGSGSRPAWLLCAEGRGLKVGVAHGSRAAKQPSRPRRRRPLLTRNSSGAASRSLSGASCTAAAVPGRVRGVGHRPGAMPEQAGRASRRRPLLALTKRRCRSTPGRAWSGSPLASTAATPSGSGGVTLPIRTLVLARSRNEAGDVRRRYEKSRAVHCSRARDLLSARPPSFDLRAGRPTAQARAARGSSTLFGQGPGADTSGGRAVGGKIARLAG